MGRSAVPHASVYADWHAEADAFVLRVHAANPKEAWSRGLILLSVVVGLASSGIAFLAAADPPGAVLTAVLIAALCITVIGFIRLSAQAREMTFIIGERSLIIDDGVKRDEVRLSDIHRLLIVHDGSPAQIAVNSIHGRFRCSIGQLYRHNRLERFVAELPVSAEYWLEAAGLIHTESRKHGVLRSVYSKRASGEERQPLK